MAAITVSDVLRWRLAFQRRSLHRAYLSSRQSSELEISDCRRSLTQLRHEQALFDEETDRDREGREAFEEHLVSIVEAAEKNIELVREAFIISLYHLWERFCVAVVRANKPSDEPEAALSKEEIRAFHEEAISFKPKMVVEQLIDAGLPIDAERIDLLRLTANVAKHSAGKSAQDLYAVRADFFNPEAVEAFGVTFETLQITDDMIDRFFDAVETSVPVPEGPMRF